MLRMACRRVAVHWTLRPARVLGWFFRPTFPTVNGASPSSTAPTPTLTFHPKTCPATRLLPATCEYFECTFLVIVTPAGRPAFKVQNMKWLLVRRRCYQLSDNSRWRKVLKSLINLTVTHWYLPICILVIFCICVRRCWSWIPTHYSISFPSHSVNVFIKSGNLGLIIDYLMNNLITFTKMEHKVTRTYSKELKKKHFWVVTLSFHLI